MHSSNTCTGPLPESFTFRYSAPYSDLYREANGDQVANENKGANQDADSETNSDDSPDRYTMADRYDCTQTDKALRRGDKGERISAARGATTTAELRSIVPDRLHPTAAA